MSFMVHCDFGKGSQNQHFQSTLDRGGGGHIKGYSVYALYNVDNSGRPLCWVSQFKNVIPVLMSLMFVARRGPYARVYVTRRYILHTEGRGRYVD